MQDAGHDVRFLVRSVERLTASAGSIGVDVSDHGLGDIADPDSVAAALDGCDAVIHCAAMVSTDPSRADEMLHTNLEGARYVLGAAAAKGLDPIIHVSSFTALFRPGLEVLHADLPVVGGSDGYGRSKAVVEAYARGRRSRVDQLASLIGVAANRSLAVFPVPDSALRGVGALFDTIGGYLPFETPINSAAMQYYTQMPTSDDTPSQRDLGVTQRDPAETLADTVAGLRRVGRI